MVEIMYAAGRAQSPVHSECSVIAIILQFVQILPSLLLLQIVSINLEPTQATFPALKVSAPELNLPALGSGACVLIRLCLAEP